MSMKKIVAFFLFVNCFNILFSQEDKEIINDCLSSEWGKAIPFSKIEGTKGTMSLSIANGLLYALEKDGVSIYDISTPDKPSLIGKVGGMGNVRQIKVCGNILYLAARENGLWSVDVSDPKNPKIISNFATIEMATGLDVKNGVAVVGLRMFGVQCVDVSNPAKMKHLSYILTDESQSVYYHNGYIFSGDWSKGEVTIIDARIPSSLKFVNKFKIDGFTDGLVVRGNYLYVSSGHHRRFVKRSVGYGLGHALEIWDISDIANPKHISRTQFPKAYSRFADYWLPRVSGDYVFAVDTMNGMFVLDAKDKKNPKIIGNIVLPKYKDCSSHFAKVIPEILDPKTSFGDPVSSVAIGDGVIYFSGVETGIYLAKMPNVARIEEEKLSNVESLLPKEIEDLSHKDFVTSGMNRENPVMSVALDGDIAYTANVWEGVKAYKLSEGKIKYLNTIKVGCAYDLSIADGKLYVAEGLNGIGIYKIVSAGNLEKLGQIPTTKEMKCALYVRAFKGKNVLIEYGDTRINFFDISNPQKAKHLLRQNTYNTLVYADFGSHGLITDRYWAFRCHIGGAWIFDISKNSVKLVSTQKGNCGRSQSSGIAALKDCFVFGYNGGYTLVNPMEELSLVGREPMAYPYCKEFPEVDGGRKNAHEGLMNVDGNKVVVSSRIFPNCRVYDFSDKKSPKLLKTFVLKTAPNLPAFWQGKLVIAGGYAGLLLEK